jgi:BTB/POZ domain-containing protein
MSAKAPENAFATVLVGELGHLLSSGKYSDLTVHCEDNTWKVHKLVMCTHSKFFVKACDGEFMVREMLSLFVHCNAAI